MCLLAFPTLIVVALSTLITTVEKEMIPRDCVCKVDVKVINKVLSQELDTLGSSFRADSCEEFYSEGNPAGFLLNLFFLGVLLNKNLLFLSLCCRYRNSAPLLPKNLDS